MSCACSCLRHRGGHLHHKAYSIAHGVIYPAHTPAMSCLELGGGAGGGSTATYIPPYPGASYAAYPAPLMTYADGYGPLGLYDLVVAPVTAPPSAWTSFAPPGHGSVPIPPTVPQLPPHIPAVPELGAGPAFLLGLALLAGTRRWRGRRLR